MTIIVETTVVGFNMVDTVSNEKEEELFPVHKLKIADSGGTPDPLPRALAITPVLYVSGRFG